MKKLKIYLTVAVIALACIYSFTWYLAVNKLEFALNNQIDILEKKGYNIAHKGIHFKGFPFSIDFEIDSLLIESPAPFSASLLITGLLKGHATIFNPTFVDLMSNEGVKITTALLGKANNTVLQSSGLSSTISLKTPLENFEITFQSNHISAVDVKADSLTFGVKLHESDRSLNIYSFKITRIDSGRELIAGLPQIIDSLEFQISVNGKFKLDVPLEQTIANWYDTEGILDINPISLHWGGLKINMNGTFSLDESLQPLAAFSAKIYGLDIILEKMSDLGLIHKNLLPLLKTSLSFLKKSETDSQNAKNIYHELSITFQDSDVVIGSIPIMKMPPINWSKLGE